MSEFEKDRFDGSALSRAVVRGACPHDCPDTCALVTIVENGRAVSVKADDSHPPTAGFLCNKVNRYLERTYSEKRLLYPMRSVGEKGEGRFVRISWDEALDTIADKFKEISAEYGPEAILPYSYAGTMGLVQGESMDHRFFHRLGASLLQRTICASAGAAGYKYTIGASVGTDMERFDGAKLVIIWGSNTITSNVHLWPRILAAKRKGVRVVAIDPYRSLTAEKCDEHIAPLPGTDGALALAMMHVIINEELFDRAYVEKHTLGFEQLRERVRGWTPEKAAAIVSLPADTIVRLAREYASVKPAVIRLNYGMQRHAGGGMAVRCIACLPALVGAWRDASGGILLSSSGNFGINSRSLSRPDLIWNNPRSVNMSAIGDALLGQARFSRPGTDGTAVEQIMRPLDPPIKAIFVYNSNPVAVAPDSHKVIAGFKRKDLFTVVHEIFQTDTADYADILLPATTQLEQFDVHKSYGHLYVLANNPAIAPLGESRANTEVFRLLAAKMGFSEDCFRETDEEIGRQALDSNHPAMKDIDFECLKKKGWQRLSVPEEYAPFAEGNFYTPSGKCEFYSETMAKHGLDPLPNFIPPAESAFADPARLRTYPLAMISPPAHSFLNSSFVNLSSSLKVEKEPIVVINPADAEARFIEDGAFVKIFNDRGSFIAKACVSERARVGVLVALSVWWKKLTPHGDNANNVTSQRLTDLGAAATFYDVLVEVESL